MSWPMSDISGLYDLTGLRALVTGPTRGIGLATARLLASAGAELVLADIDASACDALADELGGISIPTDVADRTALEDLAGACGNVDVLICNAGIAGPAGPMHNATDVDRDRLFAVNMGHPLILSGLIAPRMAERGSGSIVLLSSIAGLRGNGAIGLYGMTKAAVSQLARNLAVEWGPSGVRANAIAPGLVATEWADAIIGNPEARKKRLGATPLRRVAEPEEIASVALFLSCRASSFVTGQTLVVDGGTIISDGS